MPGTQADLRLVDGAGAGVFPLGPTRFGDQAELQLGNHHTIVVGDPDTGKRNRLNLVLRGASMAGHRITVCDPTDRSSFDWMRDVRTTDVHTGPAESLEAIEDLRDAVLQLRAYKAQFDVPALLVISCLDALVHGSGLQRRTVGALTDLLSEGPAADRLLDRPVDTEDVPGRGRLQRFGADPVQFQTYLVDVDGPSEPSFRQVRYDSESGLIEFQLGQTVSKSDRDQVERILTQMHPGTVMTVFDPERHRARLTGQV